MASLALFTGDRDLARRTIEEAKVKRIGVQIEPDGRQPLELTRTLSFSYSLFNLQALFDLASLGEKVGVDLWHFQTPDGRSLRAALDLLAPYVDAERAWPNQQIHAIGLGDRLGLAALLRRAAIAYREPRYEALLERLPAKAVRASRMQILWPPVAQREVARPKLQPRAARIGYGRRIEMRVGTNRKRQANLFDPDGTRIELMEPNTIDGKPTPSSTALAPR